MAETQAVEREVEVPGGNKEQNIVTQGNAKRAHPYRITQNNNYYNYYVYISRHIYFEARNFRETIFANAPYQGRTCTPDFANSATISRLEIYDIWVFIIRVFF